MKINWILTCPFSTNTYFVWNEDTKNCSIVDPGADSKFIIEKINEYELNPSQIWLTHGHFDHMFAAGALQEYYKIPLYMNTKDTELFDIFYDQAVAFGFDPNDYKDLTNVIHIKEDDILKLDNEIIKIIDTPGHTKGSVCFITNEGILCGDLIFQQSIGRTDLYGGDQKTLLDSIKNKILPLSENTVLYPGHGCKTSIKSEKKANPFIQF